MDLPFIFPGPILLFPNFLDVGELCGGAVHNGIAMFCTNDDLVLITFNVCSRTTTTSVVRTASEYGDTRT